MRIDCVERFEALLAALERELAEATDEEILEAASDLRMNPAMKGSAAFFGIAMRVQPPLGQGPGRGAAPGARRRPKDDPGP